MGADGALPALSDRAPSLFSYFKQRFAQVTNPAIDSLREDLVMSLTTWLGTRARAARGRAAGRPPAAAGEPGADGRGPDACGLVAAAVGGRWTRRGRCRWASRGWRRRSSGSWATPRAPLRRAPTSSSSATVASRPSRAPIPSLLAVAAVHHELVRAGLRTRCSLVVDSGEPREVHHVACLVGYGADAVHPLARGRRDRARAGQGPAEGDVEDGRLDGLRLSRRAGSSRRSGSGRS